MAKRQGPGYQTRIVTPEVTPSGWKKEGIVIKTMYHAYGFSGKIGDVIDIDPQFYDELVEKNFIKPL